MVELGAIVEGVFAVSAAAVEVSGVIMYVEHFVFPLGLRVGPFDLVTIVCPSRGHVNRFRDLFSIEVEAKEDIPVRGAAESAEVTVTLGGADNAVTIAAEGPGLMDALAIGEAVIHAHDGGTTEERLAVGAAHIGSHWG